MRKLYLYFLKKDFPSNSFSIQKLNNQVWKLDFENGKFQTTFSFDPSIRSSYLKGNKEPFLTLYSSLKETIKNNLFVLPKSKKKKFFK